jgi:hypothetical protein
MFADLFGVNPNDIISVSLTPEEHRNVGGNGTNIHAMIMRELKKLGGSETDRRDVWKAHRNVYQRLKRVEWAQEVYVKYIRPFGIPWD